MGNSVSPGLGNSANHGLRDVGMAEPGEEVERPPENLKTNRKSQDTNRKSQIQLLVLPNPYNIPTPTDNPKYKTIGLLATL